MTALQRLDGAPAFRSWTLRQLRDVASFDSAAYVPLTHFADGPTVVNRDRGEVLGYCRRYAERPAHYQPGLTKGCDASRANGGAYVDTDVYTPQERDSLPFFADIIRPQGITSQVVVSVCFQRRSRCSIHLCRHGRSPPFCRADGMAVARLVPALAVAQAALDCAASPGEQATPVEVEQLGERELAVARLVARGLRNGDIAALLGTSPHTVRNQVAAIFQKLGVRSRTQLASRVNPARESPREPAEGASLVTPARGSR